jgi:hypothetical protein
VALTIAIVACSLFFWYWDVQRIAYWAWGWFGKILGMSSFTDSWRQSGAQQIDDRWDFLWSNEPSSTLGSYATEKPASQSN